jgi:hypothetical protein
MPNNSQSDTVVLTANRRSFLLAICQLYRDVRVRIPCKLPVPLKLSGLCDTERSRALARFEIIHPFLEVGVPFTRLAGERRIVARA